MDRSAIIAGIKSALGEVLMDQVSDVSEETLLFEELYLDSTAILELLMAMEDTLGIEVDTENLNMETFKTIGTLADYVSVTLHLDSGSVRS
jgi:acyl carrier protein